MTSEGLRVAGGTLHKTMTTKAFCHFYDTTSILLFELVVYIFDSLSDQIEHFDKMLLLKICE